MKTSEQAKITDVSQVPEFLTAGERFVLTADKTIAQADETVILDDMKTMFRVDSIHEFSACTVYTLQLIGTEQYQIPGRIFHIYTHLIKELF